MSARFEELDWRETPMGAISLRRRREPLSEVDVYEVKLDDDYLMSSLFTVAEVEVARLALAWVDGSELSVAVGGLGLGYTAQTVLDDPRVSDLVVIDAIAEVIEWHERGLIPLGAELTADAAAGWCTATSSRWSTARTASTRLVPADSSTRSSSTSTTRPGIC